MALRVIEIFESLGVEYYLGGSYASSIHGVPRQTQVGCLQAGARDLHYLRHWARELSLSDLLERALAAAKK